MTKISKDNFYQRVPIDDIGNTVSGRPQVTIGMSYGFLPYLAKKLKDTEIYKNKFEKIFELYNNFIDENKIIFTGLSSSSIDVFKGFIFLILYTSYISVGYMLVI